MALLDGCYLKLERSLEHLNTLNQARERAFEAEAGVDFTLRGELNSQRNRLLLTVSEVQPLPVVEWGIIVGDAVHNLRSALDQMVYAAATEPTGYCAFPICRTAKDWAITAPAMVYSIPDDLLAVVDASQPYKRGNSAHTHPLAILGRLSNLDKHQTIPTTALTPVAASATCTPRQGIAWHGEIRLKSGRAMEPETVIAEIDIKTDDSGLEPQMDVECGFEFDVAFGEQPTPSEIRLKQIVPTFNEVLGGYTFSVIRHASQILEPHVARPMGMEFGVGD